MVANPSPSRLYTLEEYFALENVGDARYEYWDGEIVCMSGGTLNHSAIAMNTAYRLRSKLAGGPCRVFGSDLPIRTPTAPPYRYPGVSVVCGEPRVETIHGAETLLNPTIIIEVLSPSTESRDRGGKFIAYLQLPTFMEYLLVSQDTPHVTHHIRQHEDAWLVKELGGPGAQVQLASLGCELSLAEIYEGVSFAQPK